MEAYLTIESEIGQKLEDSKDEKCQEYYQIIKDQILGWSLIQMIGLDLSFFDL